MKALIVDDDLINRKFLSAMLEGEGNIELAKSGYEALDKIKDAKKAEEPYDVIFLDIMMPHMDGIETLSEIRAYEAELGLTLENGVKVVMVTALADKQNVLSAFSQGCEYYLVKPIQQEKLFDLLKELGFKEDES